MADIGFLKMNNAGWLLPLTPKSFPFTTGYTEFLPSGATYATKLSANFTNPSTNKLQYIGAETKPFIIQAAYTNEHADKFAIEVAINGIEETNSETFSFQSIDMSLTYAVTLSTNDEVSILVKEDTSGTRDVYAYYFYVIG